MARWGLENPSHLPHALERLEDKLPPNGPQVLRRINRLPSDEKRQLARAALATILAQTGDKSPNLETVPALSKGLLDQALSLKQHSPTKAREFLEAGYEILNRLVLPRTVSPAVRDLISTTERHVGYQEGSDPTPVFLAWQNRRLVP